MSADMHTYLIIVAIALQCNTKPLKLPNNKKVRLLIARSTSKCDGVANALTLLGQRHAGSSSASVASLECDPSTGAIFSDEGGCAQAAKAIQHSSESLRPLQQ